MNKRIKIVYYTLVIVAIALLVPSCSENPKDTNNIAIQNEDKNSNETRQETSSASIDNLVPYNWELFKSYGQDVGAKMQEIIETKHGDFVRFKKEDIVAGMMEFVYLYSSCADYHTSTCTAILTNGWDIFPEDVSSMTIDDINRYFGNNYVYYKSNGNKMAKLVYNFQDYIVTFYLNPDNVMEISDMCIEISPPNMQIDPQEIITAYEKADRMDLTNRNSDKWTVVNENINLFNKNENDIKSDPNWEFAQGKGYHGNDYYENKLSKIRLVFDNLGECDQILIPNISIYGELSENSMDLNGFYNYWGSPFNWGNYEDAGYIIYFDDLKVMTPSDSDGNVDINNYTIVGKPD